MGIGPITSSGKRTRRCSFRSYRAYLESGVSNNSPSSQKLAEFHWMNLNGPIANQAKALNAAQ